MDLRSRITSLETRLKKLEGYFSIVVWALVGPVFGAGFAGLALWFIARISGI